MFPPTYLTCNCCCVTFVSLFINLRHPQYFMSHTSRRGTFYEYIEMRIFGPSEFFCSSGRGSFLVIWAPWHAGRPPGPHTQVWAMAEVRPTCSRGPKSQVPSGRHSEHVEPSSCLQTHVQATRTSDGSCGIWDLECHQCRRTVLTSTTFTPDTNRPDMRPLLIQ